MFILVYFAMVVQECIHIRTRPELVMFQFSLAHSDSLDLTASKRMIG